jgi:ABC-2 type transport system permease protein
MSAQIIRRARLIAKDELRLMRRNRVAMLGLLMLLALSVIAALTSIAHRDTSDQIRTRFQAEADKEFDGQPARHPHRMVHYGHFVFRPLPALAAFDSGVDGFTGNTIFLEGHRQNSANFGDVRQSSLLMRFGQLTPAFVLQALAPLVLIFIGFGIVVRERERGTLHLLQTHGATAAQILSGKAMALSAVALLMLFPAILALGWLIAAKGAPVTPALVLLTGYTGYLAIWIAGILLASTVASQARTALIALVGLWALTVILLPRLAPDLALATKPTLTRLETDIAIQRDLRQMGDSHNPDDPFFTAFKERTLKHYGVEKVDDLPVNYRGLLAVEGEKLTSKLFDDYATRQFAQQKAQSGFADAFGLISPTLALRRVSMALAGTDLESHRRFLAQSEAYRFSIVQQLNQLQATAVTYSDDSNRNKDPEAGRRVRIDPDNWRKVPDFAYRPPTQAEKLSTASPGLAMLALWLAALALALRAAVRHIREAV